MLRLRKPSPDTITRFLDEQRELDLTYPCVGATASDPPVGFVLDHTRVRLGEGEAVFAAAKSALESWQQFQLGWLSAWPANAALRKGEVVAVVARSIGLWWLNACRIVYVIDEELREKKFGFAYGTLPDHAGSGEERFLVEMDDEEIVWYDILAFSRPNRVLARIGYPFVRRVQKRFGQDSAEAMQQTVRSVVEMEAIA
jgi:uncharacterized protein (UPF0548 family)